MLHPRKERNGDKTHMTQKDKEGKEGATQVCYHVVPRRAHERSNERPACATNRDQQRCGTNGGAGRGKGKRAPTHARLRYVIRHDAATNVVPTMHDEGPHTPTLPLVSQGATRKKAGEEKDRDTHQGGGREKVRAGEKGEQRTGKRATKPRTKQGVASSRARDARREGGTAGTRHTAGTTTHRSTGEGSTRGTREERHRAPRYAPHRHHTHRTHPHPRAQHVASEPRQPAQRAGSRGRGSA